MERRPRSDAGSSVEFGGVSLTYGDTTSNPVIEGLDLTIGSGEFFVIVGPSGCGKSTLLRMVAGFLRPTTGTVTTNGEAVDGPSAERAMVFQSVDGPLLGWLTVRQNIAFGLKLQAKANNTKFDRSVVDHWLGVVGLSEAGDKYPHELSGGMKQRVQIARILAVKPDVVLMDEPFAALDAQSRRLLQQEVSELWRAEGRTYVYVTHDIREAVLLGNRVGVMTAGPRSAFRDIHTIDLPYPRDEFSAEFGAVAKRIEDQIVEEVMQTWRHSGATADR